MRTNNDLHLDRRVQKDLIVSDDVYICGLFDIVQWLVFDMEGFAKEEGRYFGIMPTHFYNMKQAFSRFNKGCTEDMCDIYGKIFYLFKPLIINEYGKLGDRKLSKADRIIVISKRILDLLVSIGEERDHEKLEPMKSVQEIITKMFNRIRNDGKNIELRRLIALMKQYIDKGVVGKICVDEFSMQSEIEKREAGRQPVTNDGAMVSENNGRTIWKEK